jgi:hypothetical protein
MYLQKHPAVNITKYEIAELTRRPYLREYDTVARADNYFAEYRMLFLQRHSNERDIFRGGCIDVIKSRFLFVSHPASIYLYNQFQGLRPSGLRLSHQHSYPTLSSALNIFSDGVFLLLLKTALFGLECGYRDLEPGSDPTKDYTLLLRLR